MSAQPLPNVTRIISSNVLSLPAGFEEPAVENKKEVLEPLVGFGGNVRRTFIGTQEFPPTNTGSLPAVTDPDFGVALPGGTNVYYLDLAPGFETPMHRTISTDYLYVVSGTPTFVTPKGAFNIVDGKPQYNETEENELKVGDLIVQRGEMHSWKNNTDSWVRMLGFIVHAKDLEVEVGEDKQKKVLGEIWM